MSGHSRRLAVLEAAGGPLCRGCLKVASDEARHLVDGTLFDLAERIHEACIKAGSAEPWTDEERRQRAIDREADQALGHAEIARLTKALRAYDSAVPPSRRCHSCFRCAPMQAIPALAARVARNIQQRREEEEERLKWEQQRRDSDES